MKLTSLILCILSFFVLPGSCSGQTKEIPNENELSILLFNDTISYYNGILDKKSKVTTIRFDSIAITELIKKNKEKYGDALKVLTKLSNASRPIDNAVKVLKIARTQNVYAIGFDLTKADKTYFDVVDISWEPPDATEVRVGPTKTTRVVEAIIPSLIVEIQKDKSVWYAVIESAEHVEMQRIREPVKDNLKKIIAAYKEKCQKENLEPACHIRGDRLLEYASFIGVLSAFKENGIYNFQMTAFDETGDNTYKENPHTLYMPKSEHADIKATDTLNLILLTNNVLAYRETNIAETEPYDYKTIRQLLMKESERLGDNLFVAIKMSDETYHEHFGNILTEMLTCKIRKYSKVNLSPVDTELIKKFNGGN